jgi:hypothetical protein
VLRTARAVNVEQTNARLIGKQAIQHFDAGIHYFDANAVAGKNCDIENVLAHKCASPRLFIRTAGELTHAIPVAAR